MFASLMMKKRREEALLLQKGIGEIDLDDRDDTAFKEAHLPPNGFGGSAGDYMRERLKQIPGEKAQKMLGRFPHVLEEVHQVKS